MNWKLFLLLIGFVFTFFSTFNCFGQNEIPSEISYALKTGNAGKLVTFFNSQVELQINGKEDIYSLAQAEIILKNFFSSNKPNSFEIKHKGNQEKSQYFIGTLSTINGEYRTYIFLKVRDNKKYIYQLRFEVNNE